MNQLQVFSNERLGKIRTMNIDGQPYFVGKDIAEALGYEKPRNAIATRVKIPRLAFIKAMKGD